MILDHIFIDITHLWLVAPEEDAGNVLVRLELLDEPRQHFLFVDDSGCELSNAAPRDLKTGRGRNRSKNCSGSLSFSRSF